MTPPPAILSIQSHVAFGHVGNSAAVLPLQRQGFEVYQLNTVHLAHHPGYGSYCGAPSDPAALMAMLDGLERIGALNGCAAVLSGYLGSAGVGDVVEEAVRRVRARRPGALYCCDPVIGDEDTGIFVRPEIPALFAERLTGMADILAPNVFELALLSGRAVRSPDDALGAARELQGWGAGTVVATGLPVGDDAGIGVLAAERDAAWLVRTPRIPVVPHGTGDAFSALYLGHFLASRSVPTALGRATAAMFRLVERTHEEGGPELALIAAQDAFAASDMPFEPVRIA